jgi:chromate transporter
MLLPGPEAQQLAIYIGWLMHRTIGGLVAGAFFVIPSVFVLLLLSYIYAAYGNIPIVNGVLDGFKPVVVAVVVEALVKIGNRALKLKVHYGIALLSFIAIYFLQIPFPLIVLAAALIGLAGTRLLPSLFDPIVENNGKTTPARDGAPEFAVRDGATPEHTVPSRSRAIRIVAVGIALWLLPFIVLMAWSGANSFYTDEYKFFTVAALVTFGGAYAVLAYVSQAVTTAPFNWITPEQAVDGLALAETTPGPLIMVLQFVGFMAGWNNPPTGFPPVAGGVIGALIATYTTFLPSFVFIFLGAPYIEKLRGNKFLSGSLSGVTAAVVGVILNLALVFGAAVILSDAKGPDWFALLMSLAAFVALFVLKMDVLWVILAGGIIGIVKLFLFDPVL